MKHIPLLLIIVLLVSCNMGKSGKSQDNEKPVIAVTIEPQRYFTEAIAGDKFDVISIVPKGSSPETYDPTPQQLVSLGDSSPETVKHISALAISASNKYGWIA